MTHQPPTAEAQEWFTNFTAAVKLMDAGKFKEAASALEKVVFLAEKLNLPEELTDTLCAQGDAYRLSNQFDKAEASLRKAAAYSMEKQGEGSIAYAFSISALGRLLLSTKKLDEAAPLFEKACEIFRRNHDNEDPEFLPVFFAHIAFEMENEKFQSADQNSRYALDLSKRVLGQDDMATIMAMNLCIYTATALGDNERAEILTAEAEALLNDPETKKDGLGVGRMMQQI